MAKLSRAVFAALLISATAHAADSKMAGKLTIDGDVQGYPIHEVCTLSGPDTKLTGTCTTDGPDRETTGTFDGTTLILKHAGEYQGEALKLTLYRQAAEGRNTWRRHRRTAAELPGHLQGDHGSRSSRPNRATKAVGRCRLPLRSGY